MFISSMEARRPLARLGVSTFAVTFAVRTIERIGSLIRMTTIRRPAVSFAQVMPAAEPELVTDETRFLILDYRRTKDRIASNM